MEQFCNVLLNQKDVAAQELLNAIISEESAQLPLEISADERLQILTRKTQGKLLQLSSSLLIKLGPSVKTILTQKNALEHEDELVKIDVPKLDPLQKANIYSRMFFAIVNNDETTSLSCINKRLLGNLTEKEMFMILLYVFITCKRVRNDDIFSLYISGISSVGKSKVIESVILQSCHNFCTSYDRDSGVGRFNTGNKNVLFLHDISVKSLLTADCEKIKALCRAETVSAKTFGSVTMVEPMFVLATSNERLQVHTIAGNSKSWPLKLPSEANLLKKNASQNLVPIQSRFLELYIRKKPIQSEEDLKNSDCFTKRDAILGLYKPVLNIMKKYGPKDFHSVYLYTYTIHSLHKHVGLFENFFNENLSSEIQNVCVKFACPINEK